MRKRVVSLAMAAAMALSLTACGSSSSKTETTAAATEAAKTETTAAAEGAATEAAASGVDTSAWKDKTVTCIVPYDAGGGTDTVMLWQMPQRVPSRTSPLRTVPAAAEQPVCSLVQTLRLMAQPLP